MGKAGRNRHNAHRQSVSVRKTNLALVIHHFPVADVSACDLWGDKIHADDGVLLGVGGVDVNGFGVWGKRKECLINACRVGRVEWFFDTHQLSALPNIAADVLYHPRFGKDSPNRDKAAIRDGLGDKGTFVALNKPSIPKRQVLPFKTKQYHWVDIHRLPQTDKVADFGVAVLTHQLVEGAVRYACKLGKIS